MKAQNNILLNSTQIFIYNSVIYFIAIMYLPVILLSLYAFDHLVLSWVQCCIFIIVLGIFSHKAMTAAHELLHRPNLVARLVCKLIYTLTFWLIFYTEHLYLHHSKKYFLMAEDIEWARYKESFYHFIFRAGKQGLKIIWLSENERLACEQKSILKNRAIYVILLPCAMYFFAFLFFKTSSVLLLLAAILIGIVRFAISGYLGHYGLSRNHTQTIQAWDRNDPLAKYFTIGSTRHSLHHQYPTKHFYEIIKAPTSTAELPYCYEVMYLAALVPLLFFKIMDKKFSELTGVVTKNIDTTRISNLSTLNIKII